MENKKTILENAQLYEALAKAQGTMNNAKFNKMNPHFRNKYADLSSIMETCKKPLSENGLSVLQIIQTNDQGQMFLVTRLAHISGQFIESSFILRTEKNTIQGLGSAITYARRYSLTSLLGIVADEDDDGEAASIEEEKYITFEQAKILSNKINSLNNGGKMSVLKAIGTTKLNQIKKDKYESVLNFVDNALKKAQGE